MNKVAKAVLLLIFSGGLSSCVQVSSGGEDTSIYSSYSAPSSPSSSITGTVHITSAYVEGSAPADATGTVPINSAINNGAFAINWQVDNDVLYNMRAYFSLDGQYDENQDRFIFSRNCGDQILFTCRTTGRVECTFDASNVMDCGPYSSVDLTGEINSLPQNGYIILRACDALITQCDFKALPIQLQ